MPTTSQSPLISRRKGTSSKQQTMGSYGSTTDTSSNAHSIYHATNSKSHNANTNLDMNEIIMLKSVMLNAMSAGIIIIFSNTIMPALSKQDMTTGIEVMNTINVIIVNPLFIVIFFGGLISVVPAVSLLQKEDNSNPVAGYYALASTLIYFFGQFIVTGKSMLVLFSMCIRVVNKNK